LNFPLLVGPLSVVALIEFVTFVKNWVLSSTEGRKSTQKKKRTKGELTLPEKLTLGGSVVSGLFLLSLAPHQELRFLVPLVFPLILVLRGALIEKWLSVRYFLPVWILFNTVLAIFFGVFHQGGVLPSLIYLQNRTSKILPHNQVDIVYTYTYMPPRSLLTIPANSENIHLYDAGGLTALQLHEFVSNLTKKQTKKDDVSSHVVFVVSPLPISEISSHTKSCEQYELETEVWPHFSSEHFSASGKDLTLRVYRRQQSCE